MTMYLVEFDWYQSDIVGVFSSRELAEEAIQKHCNWMNSTVSLMSRGTITTEENYTISELPLDFISDEWYNDTINDKE